MNPSLRPSSTYSPLAEFTLAIVGEPFTGKTCLAFDLMPPDFAVLDYEHKIAPAKERIGDKPFYYITPDRADDNTPIPLDKVFMRSVDLAKAALTEPKVTGLIIDSITSAGIFLEAHLVKFAGTGKDLIIGGERVMTKSHWNPYKDLFRKFILALKTYGKPVICIFHERLIESDDSPTVLRPMIGGQSKDTVLKDFSDSWRIETKTCSVAERKGGYKRIVRTEPIARLPQLGHSAKSLPAELDMDPAGAYLDVIRNAYPMLCPQA